jgi:hypothetical protein
VGLAKAQSLAQDAGVTLTTVVTALEDFTIEPETWQGIVSIFCHLPPPLRSRLHREAVAGLVPGGVFILEAYTPRQLGRGTGGPPIPELLMPLDEVSAELDGLDLVIAREIERDVVEGRFHTGTAHVLQIVGVK